MLPHYSPLKVAETFSLLAGLFPGRIDLGIGRASGTDPLTTFALQRDRRQAAPDDFPQQLAELLAYLDDDAARRPPVPRGSPASCPGRPSARSRGCSARRRRARSGPRSSASPTRSPTSSTPAARQIAAPYRERFTPSERLAAPRVAVGAWVICADTDEEAQRLASSSRMTLTLLRRGRLIPVPPVEKALRFLEPRAAAGRRRARAAAIVGSPGRRVRGGARGARRGLRRRGGDRRDDHPRPRGAPALLRAARRGVRANVRRTGGLLTRPGLPREPDREAQRLT